MATTVMTKRAVTVGCGSKNGRAIVDNLINRSYRVINLGSSPHPDCENILLNWNDIDITNLHKIYRPIEPVDFVFFNQNGSSLSETAFDIDSTLEMWKLLKDWRHTHWISCQMPFLLLNYLKEHLHAHSKIGWMLSSTMRWTNQQAHRFPDYAAQKYFNFLAMQGWAKHFETFGIVPDFNMIDATSKMDQIMHVILSQEVKSRVFDMKEISSKVSEEKSDHILSQSQPPL